MWLETTRPPHHYTEEVKPFGVSPFRLRAAHGHVLTLSLPLACLNLPPCRYIKDIYISVNKPAGVKSLAVRTTCRRHMSPCISHCRDNPVAPLHPNKSTGSGFPPFHLIVLLRMPHRGPSRHRAPHNHFQNGPGTAVEPLGVSHERVSNQ